MIMNGDFFEHFQVISGFVPVDMAAGNNNGDWVNMENYENVSVILYKGAGTAGDDPDLLMEQATGAGGANSKNLNFSRIWKKQGTLTAIPQYSLTVQTPSQIHQDATSAEVEAIWGVTVRAEDLDVANNFTHMRARVLDIGANAQLGALLYIAGGARYGLGVDLPSGID